jgi:hypothetical protein
MVSAELAAFFDGPFVWGQSDCCTCVCDAFAARFGIDPMAPLRDMYCGEADAREMIKAWGGWVKMFRSLADLAGLPVSDPAVWSDGAIGLALTAKQGPALVYGAADGLWIGKVDSGFATTNRVILSCRN